MPTIISRMKKMTRNLLVFMTCLALLNPGIISSANNTAQKLYVTITGLDTNDCLSPANACGTIQRAVNQAVSGDQVLIEQGTYLIGEGPQGILVDRDVQLSGGWDPSFTIQAGMSTLSGGQFYRGIVLQPGVTSTIERMIVQNFTVYDGGAGIRNEGNLTLLQSVVRWNDGKYTSNGHGGGIMNINTGTMTIKNSSIVENTAYGGGGITNNGVMMIVNSTISGNDASHGAGIETNTTLNLFNVTVTRNSASTGGGIYALYNAYIQNSIVAGNITEGSYAKECYGSLTSLGYSIIIPSDGCIYSSGTGDLIGVEPGVGELIGLPAYHPLLSDSPAVNAGNPAGCEDEQAVDLTTDQRGADRDNQCDIGAYEYVIPGLAAQVNYHSGSPQETDIKTPFAEPFEAVVTDSIGTPVQGVAVSFTAPDHTASGTFQDTLTRETQSVTDIHGIAKSSQFTANEIGGPYMVIASVAGLSSFAEFNLTNIALLYLPTCMQTYNVCPDFSDDFSNPSSGWAVGEDMYLRTEYLNGEYRVRSKRAGYLFFIKAPTCVRKNYSLQVKVRWDSRTGNSYGLLFGIVGDFERFYMVDMNAEYQQYRLYRYDSGNWYTIQGGRKSTYINPGYGTNTITVGRNNGQISLSVNGHYIDTWYDDAIMGFTSVGILTSSYSDDPISDARFDDFLVTTSGTSNNQVYEYPPAGLNLSTRSSTRGPSTSISFSRFVPIPSELARLR